MIDIDDLAAIEETCKQADYFKSMQLYEFSLPRIPNDESEELGEEEEFVCDDVL